jgi:hypothetical protein
VRTPGKALVCDADCAAMFGPTDLYRTFQRLRQEARRNGWARRWINWHGLPKLADLCPEHSEIGWVM